MIVRQELTNYFIWITEMKIASNYLPFGHLVFFEVMLPPTSTESPEPEFCLGSLPPLKYFLLRCSFFYLRCSFYYLRCSFLYLRYLILTCVVSILTCVGILFFVLLSFKRWPLWATVVVGIICLQCSYIQDVIISEGQVF